MLRYSVHYQQFVLCIIHMSSNMHVFLLYLFFIDISSHFHCNNYVVVSFTLINLLPTESNTVEVRNAHTKITKVTRKM